MKFCDQAFQADGETACRNGFQASQVTGYMEELLLLESIPSNLYT